MVNLALNVLAVLFLGVIFIYAAIFILAFFAWAIDSILSSQKSSLNIQTQKKTPPFELIPYVKRIFFDLVKAVVIAVSIFFGTILVVVLISGILLLFNKS